MKGIIIGFEEYGNYSLEDAFGEASPFRLLVCDQAPISFVVVNPYSIVDDYSFEVDEDSLNAIRLNGNAMQDLAVLCIVRPDEHCLYVNLRSPIVVNVKDGLFRQVILQDEKYGVSVPFVPVKGGT